MPEIHRIPLIQIRPSKRNTRKIIQEDMVEARRASMASGGQTNPIVLRPLTDKEKLEEPDKNILFEIVDGEIRYWAAKKNGDTEIDAIIKNLTPEQAFKESIKGNLGFKPNWFEMYLAMEEFERTDLNIQKQEIAALFEVDNAIVTRALNLIRVLTPGAKDLLFEQFKKSEGTWQITERPIYRLTDLGDPNLIEKAIPVVLNLQLTEPQVKDLVEWIQSGKDPAQFEPTVKERKQKEEKRTSSKQNKRFKHETKKIDTLRISVNPYTYYKDFTPDQLHRKTLSMKATGFQKVIMVRALSAEERAADPDHDYEVFDDPLELEAAKRLGWPTVDANVFYDMDVWEAIGLLNSLDRVTRCSTWVEGYYAIEKLLSLDPKSTVAEEAISLGMDPDFTVKVYPAMKLLNRAARVAIMNSILKCHEGRTDLGGYRFTEWLVLPLIPLKDVSKDLEETQKVVEEVVNIAIEKGMGEEEIEGLVDWVLDGNSPGDYVLEEA